MQVNEKQSDTLFWFKLVIISNLLIVFFPDVLMWAYEFEKYFGFNFPEIVELNEKELVLFDGFFLLAEEELYILLFIFIIHPILLFFRYRISKLMLPLIILLYLPLGVQGIFMEIIYDPFDSITSYIEGISVGLIIYFCYFSSIKDTFNRSIIPQFLKSKK